MPRDNREHPYYRSPLLGSGPPYGSATRSSLLYGYPPLTPLHQTHHGLPVYTYSTGGPVQQPLPQLSQPYTPLPAPPSVRASSGAWTPTDDHTLMEARKQGMNWAPIQSSFFPTKTPNACRKRHERLIERKNSDDWDAPKLERLARAYIDKRREIWMPLAEATGEKWTVVEEKCMASGLINLKTAARSQARRERADRRETDAREDSSVAFDDYENDGSSDLSSDRQQYYANERDYAYAGNGVNGRAYSQQRLPSIDMGIDSIINRPSGRVGRSGRR